MKRFVITGTCGAGKPSSRTSCQPRPHIEYNQWIGQNRGKYQLFIDTEHETPDRTADRIAAWIGRLTD